MKYFVTGATGFIGGHLARQLRAQNHEVIALVRQPASAKDLAPSGVQLVQGDILQKDSLRAPMTGVDGVFHVAGWYKVGIRDTGQLMRINVEGTRNVLGLMQELQIPKGVYTSSVVINSDTHGKLVDESYRYDGPQLTVYDRSKWIAHYEVAEALIEQGLPLVIVMPGIVYGPGDSNLYHDGLVQYLRGQMAMVPAGLVSCPAHVDDVAQGHILAMDKGQPGQSYYICGDPLPYIEQLKLAEAITGIPAPKFQIPPALVKLSAVLMSLIEKIVPVPPLYSSENLRSSAGATYMADNSKAKRDLGYQPRPLAEGLRQTLEYEMAELEIQPPSLSVTR